MKKYMGNSCVPPVASGKAESMVIICYMKKMNDFV